MIKPPPTPHSQPGGGWVWWFNTLKDKGKREGGETEGEEKKRVFFWGGEKLKRKKK